MDTLEARPISAGGGVNTLVRTQVWSLLTGVSITFMPTHWSASCLVCMITPRVLHAQETVIRLFRGIVVPHCICGV